MAEKDRKMVLTHCLDCGCDIFHRPNKPHLRCRKCWYKFNSLKNNIEYKCSHCGKLFLRRKSAAQNSRHKIYFCNRKCKEKAQSLSGKCKEIRPFHYGDSNGKHLWKILIKKAEKCSSCEETKKYLLVVHHIDGDREHNEETNLEIVCCNCHCKRHMKLDDNNEWGYDSKCLTPRDMINKL